MSTNRIFLRAIALSLLFSAQVSHAQVYSYSKLDLTLSSGISIPTEGMDREANQGLHLNLSSTYYFTKNFGVRASLNSIRNESTSFTYDQLYPKDSYLAHENGVVNTGFSYDATYWNMNSILIGAAMKLHATKFSFTFYAMLGLQQVKSPETTIVEQGYEGMYWSASRGSEYHSVKYSPSFTTYNVPLNLGYNLNYQCGKHLFILADINYMTSSANFKGDISYSKDVIDPISHTEIKAPVSFSKTVSEMSFGAGMGWRFF